MPRGYMEGPASEEREAELDRLERPEEPRREERPAVFGSTEDDPEKHFIGWPDDLFGGAENSAAQRAVSECGDSPGLGHSPVRGEERLPHPGRDDPGDEEHVGMAGRCDDAQPEPL